MEGKVALIIDEDIDFCLLMKHYLTHQDINAYSSGTLTKALDIIDLKRPDIIIAGKNITYDIEDILQAKVSSINNYAPSIKITNAENISGQESILKDLQRIVRYIKDNSSYKPNH